MHEGLSSWTQGQQRAGQEPASDLLQEQCSPFDEDDKDENSILIILILVLLMGQKPGLMCLEEGQARHVEAVQPRQVAHRSKSAHFGKNISVTFSMTM